MKLFHLSDLHLGKRVNGFSMIGEQRTEIYFEADPVIHRRGADGWHADHW